VLIAAQKVSVWERDFRTANLRSFSEILIGPRTSVFWICAAQTDRWHDRLQVSPAYDYFISEDVWIFSCKVPQRGSYITVEPILLKSQAFQVVKNHKQLIESYKYSELIEPFVVNDIRT
jgi:hypothetical protein